MAKNFLGGLEQLIQGFGGLADQDDPDIALLHSKNQVQELEEKERTLYAGIGKKAMELVRDRPEFADQLQQLQAVQQELATQRRQLEQARQVKEEQERKKRETQDACTCSACGHVNAEGVKFCQECGAKLGALLCPGCGAKLSPGVKFCGSCGRRIGA